MGNARSPRDCPYSSRHWPLKKEYHPCPLLIDGATTACSEEQSLETDACVHGTQDKLKARNTRHGEIRDNSGSGTECPKADLPDHRYGKQNARSTQEGQSLTKAVQDPVNQRMERSGAPRSSAEAESRRRPRDEWGPGPRKGQTGRLAQQARDQSVTVENTAPNAPGTRDCRQSHIFLPGAKGLKPCVSRKKRTR